MRTGKKLKDRSQYPLFLNIPELGLKLLTTLNEEGDRFELRLNNVPFFRLPYKFEVRGKYTRFQMMIYR